MLNFPNVPSWWATGTKFMKLQKEFTPPDYIVGYDTETYGGEILTQQFCTSRYARKERRDAIQWVNKTNVLDKFFEYIEGLRGHIIVYCFNSSFDMAILFREYIDNFLQDDFNLRHVTRKGTLWEVNIFCSKNWYGYFKSGNLYVSFLDIHNYFSGSLESVAETFNLKSKKLTRPKDLGTHKYTPQDKKFVEYAQMDAMLCLEIGEVIIDMHQEFDIPFSTSSANFAEKVFRRKFIPEGRRIHYPPASASRLAEITYHGGKNGYYIDNPSVIHNCYEYDFNAAYGYAMYTIPSFMAGRYKQVNRYIDSMPGVYEVVGNLKSCPYGIFHDTRFNYFRFPSTQKIRAYITSYELEEALRSKEFKIDTCKGWIWIPDTQDNPIKDYAKYFWEKKNSTPKNDIRYIFYKLLLNSLYGKWIQRNPIRKPRYTYSKGQFTIHLGGNQSGGLYNPFIASLITGFTRARLHKAEHYFSAIESSTDSVKSRRYDSYSANIKQFGVMQLERLKCKTCDISPKSFTGLFVRNRLNLLMCNKQHVMKCALHGFWGKPDVLKELWKKKETEYTIERMPLIREGIKQFGKDLFMMHHEERSLNISWDNLKVIK